MERAIKFTTLEFEHFEDELERKQWLKLATNPSPARNCLAEEFYTNLYYTQATKYTSGGIKWILALQPSIASTRPSK